jgi:nucleoside 2-deoxyribosyltransferase
MKIYLACPYSHKDQYIINERFHLVNKKAAEIMEQGHIVFSPISHSHPISEHTHVDPQNHDFWLKQDFAFIDWCDELWVYTLPGWEESEGVKREIAYATAWLMPVRYIEV